MPIYCFVPECKTSGTSGLHRFPADPQLKQEWMKRTKTNPLKNSKICRRHFKESDLLIDVDGKKILSPNAVPCLYLPLTGKRDHNYHSVPLTLNWDHGYHLINSPKKRRFKRIKISNQEPVISNDDFGNEVEIGDEHEQNQDDQVNLGPYINIAYLRSLEEKIRQQAKEKIELARKLRNKDRQLKRLQQKPKARKLTDMQVLDYLRAEKKYSTTQLEFEEMQLRNACRKPHGRRYRLKEKSMCLALYKSGPRSYRFKESNQIMALPSLSTLCRHSAKMTFRAGTNPELFQFIKEKVKDWSEADLLCSFSFDETALKARLEYSCTDDEIIGFVELAGIRRPIFATHALTFMVRGIHRQFKQPVAYFYTHGLKAFELAELITLVFEAVASTGLNVIMSVCDQVKTNETTVHRLMDTDFRRTPGCLLKYKIAGKTVIHCYDAPHVVKVVRNNLEVKNFKHFINERWNILTSKTYGKEQVASWNDVEQLYKLDRTGLHRFLPKISEEHIKPAKLKMKVCVATQVFSQTYGTVMLHCAKEKQMPEKSCATAQMLLFVNDFFDSVNGSGPAQVESLKGSINKDSVHFAFWEWALFMLAKMNYIDKTTGYINCRSTVINKIESTIRGYQEITRICLNNNIQEVSLRNTDSDGLENFFGCVKMCCQISCTMTPRQFKSGYTTMILNNLMNSKSVSTNCEPDNASALLNDINDLIITHISSIDTEALINETDDLYSEVVFDPQFTQQELNFLESESLTQVANTIRSRIDTQCFCNNCSRELEYNDHKKVLQCSPSHFTEIFQKVFEFTLKIIPSFATEKFLKKAVVEEIKRKYQEEVESFGIGCVEHNREMVNTLFEVIAIYALKIFCKNLNDYLTGKIIELPNHSSDIQDLAHTFWVKKTRIGKHSDKFKE